MEEDLPQDNTPEIVNELPEGANVLGDQNPKIPAEQLFAKLLEDNGLKIALNPLIVRQMDNGSIVQVEMAAQLQVNYKDEA